MTAAMQGQTYVVTAAGKPAGTLSCDLRREREKRWRWRTPGNVVEHFKDMSVAKDHIAWLCGCHWRDVRLVEVSAAGDKAATEQKAAAA